ncbi:hypothetical protein DFS34DRAFT_609492 [Phlyctochytrium arcticum]|nr:hypothetical protein DFS34DRAFT_609492 [Phlyctochytrium arcticum]
MQRHLDRASAFLGIALGAGQRYTCSRCNHTRRLVHSHERAGSTTSTSPKRPTSSLRNVRGKALLTPLEAALADVGMIPSLKQYLSRIQRNASTLDEKSSQIILSRLLQRSRTISPHELTEILDLMRSCGFSVSKTTNEVLIKLFLRVGNMEDAMRMVGTMIEDQGSPVERTYEIVIAGLVRAGEIKHAESHCLAMMEAGLSPKPELLELFVKACSQNAMHDEAQRWYTAYLNVTDKPSASAIIAMGRLAALQEDFERIMERFKDLRHFGYDGEYLISFYRVVILESLRSSAISLHTKELHEMLLMHGCIPDEAVVLLWQKSDGSLSTSGPSNNPYTDAETRWDAAETTTGAISIVANRTISTYAKSRSTLPLALELVRDLSSKGLSLAPASYLPILAGYSRFRDLENLRYTWRHMEQSGSLPTLACYHVYLKGLLRCNSITDAIDVLEELNDAGVLETLTIKALRIRVALRAKDYSAGVDQYLTLCTKESNLASRMLPEVLLLLCKGGGYEEAKRCWLALPGSVNSRGHIGTGDGDLLDMSPFLHGLMRIGDLKNATLLYQTHIAKQRTYSKSAVLLLGTKLCAATETATRGKAVLTELIRKSLLQEQNWFETFRLLHGVGPFYGVEILENVVNLADHAPTESESTHFLMMYYKQRDALSLARWYECLRRLSFPIPRAVCEAILGSRRMSRPRTLLEQCLQDVSVALVGSNPEGDPKAQKTVALALEAVVKDDYFPGVDVLCGMFRTIGFVPTRAQAGRLSNILSKHAFNIEQLFLSLGVPLDCQMWEDAAVSSAREGDIERAYLCLKNSTADGRDPYHGFARTIIAAAESQNPELCMPMLVHADTLGFAIHEQLYIDLASLLGKRNAVNAVFDIAHRHAAKDTRSRTLMHNLVIRAHVAAGNSGEALSLLKTRPSGESTVQADTLAYNDIIGGFVRAGYHQEARNTFQLMLAAGLTPDNITATTMLGICESCSDVDRLKQSMVNSELVPDGVFTLRTAQTYARLREPKLCEFELGNRRETLSLAGWNVLLTAYSLSGEYYECVKLFKEMQTFGVRPDSVTMGVLLDGATISPQVVSMDHEVEKWRAVISTHRLPSTIKVYNAFLRQAVKHMDTDEVERCFREVINAGVSPNDQTLTLLLRHYSDLSLSHFEKVLEDWIPQLGIKLSRKVHREILRAYADLGRPDKVRDKLAVMRQKGLPLGDSESRILLQAYINLGDLDVAEKIIVEIATLDGMAASVSNGTSSDRQRVLADADIHLLHMLVNANLEQKRFPRAIEILRMIPKDKMDAVTFSIAMKMCLLMRVYHEGKILFEWASKGQTRNGTWGFITTQGIDETGRSYSLSSRMNESMICSYIDLLGVTIKPGNTNHPTKADLDHVWKDLCSMNEHERHGWKALHYPTENMCNSYIEALARCGDARGAFKVLKEMDGGLYSPRPTPKTIRTITSMLRGSEKPGLEMMLLQLVEKSWPDLTSVVQAVRKHRESA